MGSRLCVICEREDTSRLHPSTNRGGEGAAGSALARKHERMVCCFFSSRRRHTRSDRDWSSDVCSSDLYLCLTGGSDFGCEGYSGNPNSNACTGAAWNAPNIVDRLEAGGLTWKAYLEDMPSNRSEERRVGKECRSRWSPYH